MAKSMKVPVLVFEKIEETEVLLEGLELVTTNANWRKRKIVEQLKEELQGANYSMAMTNNN
tara:strand:- start:1675 stop:1857 length:183 start_codon:yes stop_codon:yes gene_type:complete